MKKEKKTSPFFRILNILFIVYLGLFIANKTGYYEKTVRDKTILVENQITIFEQDVKNNVAVDVNSYLPKKNDYSNIFTKSAKYLSQKISNVFDSEVKSIWDLIKSLFIAKILV